MKQLHAHFVVSLNERECRKVDILGYTWSSIDKSTWKDRYQGIWITNIRDTKRRKEEWHHGSESKISDGATGKYHHQHQLIQ